MAQLVTPTMVSSIAERFTSSWALFKTSWRVVRSEPALLGLTILSLVVRLAAFIGLFLAIAALFAGSALSSLIAGQLESSAATSLVVVVVIFGMLWGLLLSAPLNTFFYGAIAHAAMARIEGKNPSIGEGLGAASRRLGSLIVFGLVSSFVSLVTSVRSSSGSDATLANQAMAVAQAAARELYRLLTSLSLPVIMREGVSGTVAISRSTEIVRAVWPQAVASGIGVRMVTGALAGIPIFIVGLILVGTFALTPFVGASSAFGQFNEMFTNPSAIPIPSFDPVTQQVVSPVSEIFAAGVADSALFSRLAGLLPLFAVCTLLASIIGTLGGLFEAVYNGALYLYATTGKAGDFDAKDLAAAAITTDGVVKPGAAKG